MNSMTGFGRAEVTFGHMILTVEIKSVNHRYLDLAVKTPRKLNFLEEKIRGLMKPFVRRGRFDIYINQMTTGESDKKVMIDQSLCRAYQKSLEDLSDELNIKNDLTVSVLAKLPEVIQVDQQDIDETMLWHELQKGILEAVEQLTCMRKLEGEALKLDMENRITLLGNLMNDIEHLSPEVGEAYRKRLLKRIGEMTDQELLIDENRIMTEVAIISEKSSIDEEIVRFKSHLSQITQTMQQDDAVGRKLDFLLQELNREINTIGSKAGDLKVGNLVVEVKSELEKIREQVQNIE
jgi:uncharacterized protein (TIGR00255 family)